MTAVASSLRGAPPPRTTSGTTQLPRIGKFGVGITAARIVLNAVEGWGKTSFGSFAPNPVILMARGETGFATLRQAGRVPDADAVTLTNWHDTKGTLDALESSDYGSVVLDAVGGFERLCHEDVCRRNFDGDWGEKGFGGFQRGPDVSVAEWLQLLQRLDRLYAAGKNVILLSHAKAVNFKNPMGPDFDRYVADCHHKTWSVTHKWADAVLFGTFVTVAKVEKLGRTKGIGGTERVIYTERCDAYDAKNRFGMPSAISVMGDASSVWPVVWSSLSGGGASASPTDAPPPL